MNNRTVEWLLQGEAWIEYRTRIDLLGEPETNPQVVTARKSMPTSAAIFCATGVALGDWFR